MKSKDIVVLVAVLLVLAVRLYRKYGNKVKDDSATGTKSNADSKISSFTKDDEYEPYSKK